jgi:hypothetical protein
MVGRLRVEPLEGPIASIGGYGPATACRALFAIINPKTITSGNAAGRLKIEARVPIRGGLTRKPKYPMVVTAAIPGPTPALCLPADPNKIGTKFERSQPPAFVSEERGPGRPRPTAR